ncbi:MAG: homoserine O-acetyltransferase, partial [Cellvibrionales bacterium]|nr:homoserine O-acetyltransferase [Cellvibrionales bacterium]
IAFNETARTAIMSDDAFHQGRYFEQNTLPQKGLSLARMIGHLTYLSDDGMDKKFGRELRSGSFQLGQDSDIEFQVASYLHYQGEKFSTQFDANSYILMTTALDYFDLAREYNDDPVAAFSHAQCNFLILSFSSDWRFSPERSKEIVDALIAANKQVVYTDIESTAGHDGFLLHNSRYESVFGAYMDRIYREMMVESSGASQ